MQWKLVSKMAMVAIPIMIVCGLLGAASTMGPTARAANEDTKVCTNHTLHGDYGSAVEGVLLNIPGFLPKRSSAQ
jgi:hypothetical protein